MADFSRSRMYNDDQAANFVRSFIEEATPQIAAERRYSEDGWISKIREAFSAPPTLLFLLPSEEQLARDLYRQHKRLKRRKRAYGMATMRRLRV